MIKFCAIILLLFGQNEIGLNTPLPDLCGGLSDSTNTGQQPFSPPKTVNETRNPQSISVAPEKRVAAPRVPNKTQAPKVVEVVDFEEVSYEFKPYNVERSDGLYLLANAKDKIRQPKLQSAPVIAKSDIIDVSIGVNQVGRSSATMQLSEMGAKAFGKATSQNIGKKLAIVVNKRVIMMPTITSGIWGGKVEITGDFTRKEIEAFAEQLMNED